MVSNIVLDVYFQSLPTPSVDLEDLISHTDPQGRKEHVTMHLLYTHLAAMPSGHGPRGALMLYQWIYLTISRSPRIQTHTLD